MDPSPVPRPTASASVLSAGILAVILGALGVLFNSAGLLLFSSNRLATSAPFPAAMRPVFYVVWTFLDLCSLFVLVAGIHAIRLREWARVSLLVAAGCMLFFGGVGLIVIVVALFAVSSSDPLVSRSVLASVLGVTYGIPIVIAIWWLVLFTRKPVVAQFKSAAAATPTSTPLAAFRFSKPGCPLAAKIVGWYLASFVLMAPLLPFFPGRYPAYFFGYIVRGPRAVALLALYFATFVVPGFGLLLLKRWSLPLAIASQVLICINGLSAVFSPAYAQAIREMFAQTDLPSVPGGLDEMWSYARYFNLLSLLIPIAIIITLLYVRRSFFAAANAQVREAPITGL